MEAKSSEVLEKTKQDEEIRARWSWVKPEVWTTRMLTALEKEVKGGIWYSLIDKVYSERTLRLAFDKVKAKKGGAGVDHVTIEQFGNNLEENIGKLSKTLASGEYKPQSIKRVYIPKPGSRDKRPLGIPTVRDRVVQTALREVLEPIFEKDFAGNSYGFRPGRGCKDALREVDKMLKQGAVYVVDADLQSYFDSIPHDKLMMRVRRKIADSRILNLIEMFLNQGILDEVQYYEPEAGTPQGAVISPLLSNIYLHDLDELMQNQGHNMIRYADDLVILCHSEEEAQQAMLLLRQWTTDNELTLHPDKTKTVYSPTGSFEFLGYQFKKSWRFPRQKSLKKFRAKIRDKTRRCNKHSLSAIIQNLNPIIKGWFEYYKHSYKTTFDSVDGYIRMRIRSILRKRAKRKGIGHGFDHVLWPNKFFQAQGLFCLKTAFELACQSSSR